MLTLVTMTADRILFEDRHARKSHEGLHRQADFKLATLQRSGMANEQAGHAVLYVIHCLFTREGSSPECLLP